jgi:cation:H+ antiporter
LALAFTAFVAGAIVSLATSWLLVTRLERVGERFRLSEALLGVVAALAADTPEITSAISAISQHHRAVGAGVVIGSNVFNLAALLGLGAVVSGFIAFHRRVVILGGFVAMWVAAWCLVASTGLMSSGPSLALASIVLVGYFIILGLHRTGLNRLPLPRRLTSWLVLAIREEEDELEASIRPSRGRPRDALVAVGALFVVVVSSVAMERGAVDIGHHFHTSDAVVGGLVLAAVTSLPNAVAAVYLARRGRGAAALSTALTSNNLNVVAGLLIPGVFIGLASPSLSGNVTALSYIVLTALVLVLAFVFKGLSRRSGWLIISAYLASVIILVATS